MISSLNEIIISSILLYNIFGGLVGSYFYGLTSSIFVNDSKAPMIILLDIKFKTLLCLYKCFKYKKGNIKI